MELRSRILDRTAGAEYVTLHDAARLTGIGVGLLLNLGASDPTFPRLIRVSARKRLYRLAELRAWIESRRGANTIDSAARRATGEPCQHPQMRTKGRGAWWCADCARHICPQERRRG